MEQQDRDMLIRINTQQENMGREIGEIKNKLSQTQCQTHAEKLHTIEKITWGAVLVAIAAIVKSFWATFTR